MVDLDVEIIELLCKEESTPMDHVPVKEVIALKRHSAVYISFLVL